MDVKKLRRDPDAIRKILVETEDTTSTKVDCSIYVPAKFLDKGMAALGDDVYILGIFAIVVNEQFYGVVKAPTLVKVNPVETRREMIDDAEYLRLDFPAGSEIVLNKNVVLKDTLNYNIFDYFIDDGKVPWYLNYDDMLTLFEHGKRFTGVDIAPNEAIISMLVTFIFRDNKDKMVYYRQKLKTATDKDKAAWSTVALHSVLYGPRSTLGKLTGARFDDGLASSLITRSERVDPIEKVYRT